MPPQEVYAEMEVQLLLNHEMEKFQALEQKAQKQAFEIENLKFMNLVLEDQTARRQDRINNLQALIAELTPRLLPRRNQGLLAPPNHQTPPPPTHSPYVPPSRNTPSTSNQPRNTPNHPFVSRKPRMSVIQGPSHRVHKRYRKFTPLYMPQDHLFRELKRKGIVKPLPPPLSSPDLSPHHRKDLYCEYHRCTGHTTLGCHGLAHKIQDLLDDGTIPPPPSAATPLKMIYVPKNRICEASDPIP